MKVLIACEKSQRVCIAFRERGHEAYSCDIQDCSGGHPEWHIKGERSKPYGAELSPPLTECTMISANGTCSLHTRRALIYQTPVRVGYTLTKDSWIWRDTARGLQRKRFS